MHASSFSADHIVRGPCFKDCIESGARKIYGVTQTEGVVWKLAFKLGTYLEMCAKRSRHNATLGWSWSTKARLVAKGERGANPLAGPTLLEVTAVCVSDEGGTGPLLAPEPGTHMVLEGAVYKSGNVRMELGDGGGSDDGERRPDGEDEGEEQKEEQANVNVRVLEF